MIGVRLCLDADDTKVGVGKGTLELVGQSTEETSS